MALILKAFWKHLPPHTTIIHTTNKGRLRCSLQSVSVFPNLILTLVPQFSKAICNSGLTHKKTCVFESEYNGILSLGAQIFF